MKNRADQKKSAVVRAVESPWVQGPVLGAGVMAAVTPLLKWTNHVYNNEKMPRGNKFSGAGAYAVSAVPGYATTFVFKALLSKKHEETSQGYELATSFAAGGLSGLVCTPFEALAQNKQLTRSVSIVETAKKVFLHHGHLSVFQGATSVALREGLWSTIYMTAIPLVSESLQKRGLQKKYAEPLATVTVASAYGLFSSPLNQLRYRKQAGLTEPRTNKSYLEHVKDIFKQDSKVSSNWVRVGFFFKAGVPRAVTTTVAAGLMVKGTECYNKVVDYLSQQDL